MLTKRKHCKADEASLLTRRHKYVIIFIARYHATKIHTQRVCVPPVLE